MASDELSMPTWFKCNISSQFCCSPFKQENDMNNRNNYMEKWAAFASH